MQSVIVLYYKSVTSGFLSTWLGLLSNRVGLLLNGVGLFQERGSSKIRPGPTLSSHLCSLPMGVFSRAYSKMCHQKLSTLQTCFPITVGCGEVHHQVSLESVCWQCHDFSTDINHTRFSNRIHRHLHSNCNTAN